MERLMEDLRFSSEQMVSLATFTLRDLAYTCLKDALKAREIRYLRKRRAEIPV